MLLLARLVHRLEILRAVFDPTDGLAKTHRGEGNQKIFRIKFAAGPEAAADFGFDEMNAALRQRMRQLVCVILVGPHIVRSPRPSSNSATKPRVSKGTAP